MQKAKKQQTTNWCRHIDCFFWFCFSLSFGNFPPFWIGYFTFGFFWLACWCAFPVAYFRAFNGINGTGQDRIIAVQMKNGTRKDISQRLKRLTGKDRIFQTSTERDGTGLIFPKSLYSVISRYLTRYPDRNPAGHPVEIPYKSCLLLYNPAYNLDLVYTK